MADTFKEQQQDRIEEGKDLKHEDELRDLSQIPQKDLPATSLVSKITGTISHAASAITEKLGSKDVTLEGHEDLDKNVRSQLKKVNKEILKQSQKTRYDDLDKDVKKQVKKINKEILKQPHRAGQDAEKPSEWAHELQKHVTQETENLKSQAEGLVKKISNTVDDIKDSGNLSSKTTIQPNREGPSPLDKVNEQYNTIATKVEETVSTDSTKQGTSILGAIQQGIHGVTEKISQGVESLKQKLSGGEKTVERAEEPEDDGTKNFRKVKEEDSINETVDDLNKAKRLEELGQEKLASNNPYQALGTGSQNEPEVKATLGEKIKGGLNDASTTISGKVGEVSQKVKSVLSHSGTAPVDKENVRQAS